MTNKIWTELQEIISEFCIEDQKDSLTKELNLIGDLGLDSISIMVIFLKIEKLFKVEITSDDYFEMKLETIGDLFSFIQNKMVTSKNV